MGPHWTQILLVVGLGLLFFGPKRLPELGSSIGKTIKEFQRSMKEVQTPDEPVAIVPPVERAQLPASSAQAPAAISTPTMPAITSEATVE